ncbi:Uncharacterized protein HZ326_30074 [Fusarium oxysporum f. sp. albedinis]|nr:Uncharacterized protein HZ326_30074 [Fusarium oxysporum f. sp. albedinis]
MARPPQGSIESYYLHFVPWHDPLSMGKRRSFNTFPTNTYHPAPQLACCIPPGEASPATQVHVMSSPLAFTPWRRRSLSSISPRDQPQLHWGGASSPSQDQIHSSPDLRIVISRAKVIFIFIFTYSQKVC